jgi:hypothetical protein
MRLTARLNAGFAAQGISRIQLIQTTAFQKVREELELPKIMGLHITIVMEAKMPSRRLLKLLGCG